MVFIKKEITDEWDEYCDDCDVKLENACSPRANASSSSSSSSEGSRLQDTEEALDGYSRNAATSFSEEAMGWDGSDMQKLEVCDILEPV